MRKIVKGIAIVAVTILLVMAGCKIGRYMEYLDVDKRIESWDDETLLKAYATRSYGTYYQVWLTDSNSVGLWYKVKDPVYHRTTESYENRDRMISYIKENWE